MLQRVNSVVMAVEDRAATGARWERILGAAHDHDDHLDAWGAVRSRYRLANGWVDLLEPDGAGPVADAVRARGAHLFAGGVTTSDIGAFVDHLSASGVEAVVEGDEILLGEEATGDLGLRLVVSAVQELDQVGRVRRFYEITNLVRDAPAAVDHYAELFGLQPDGFVPIDSEHFGYHGTLTLFRSGHLDRFEVIEPTDAAKTMGRYFSKFGETLYMMFAECDELDVVVAHTDSGGFTAVRDGEGRPSTVFLHPAALGGMMLGLSRSTFAWTWSGSPDRVADPEG